MPSLVHGFVDITSNYYTGYYAICKKRCSSSNINRLDNAKRLRRSEVTNVSDVDVDGGMQDSEGFADVVDSDEEASPPNTLSDDMREQVEIFLNLDKAATKLPDYLEWKNCDSSDSHANYRDLNFDDPEVLAANIAFNCR